MTGPAEVEVSALAINVSIPASLQWHDTRRGEEFVLTCGKDSVDFVKMRNLLEDKGFRQILCEGGPSLLNSMLAAGVVDELDLTWSPVLVGGDHPTITRGPNLYLPASPKLLLEEDGTILGRWFVNR